MKKLLGVILVMVTVVALGFAIWMVVPHERVLGEDRYGEIVRLGAQYDGDINNPICYFIEYESGIRSEFSPEKVEDWEKAVLEAWKRDREAKKDYYIH